MAWHAAVIWMTGEWPDYEIIWWFVIARLGA